MTADGFTESARDDCLDFLTRHARHRLETLRPTTSRAFHTGPLWDVAPTYWQVSNGKHLAIVEGWRRQIGGARQYRLRPGRVVTERIVVEIPDDDLRQRMDRALYPGVAPERKLTAFLQAVRSLVQGLDPNDLEILYDVPGDPTLAVARLPGSALEAIQSSLRRIFDQVDSAKLIAGLVNSDDAIDGFTVLVRQRVRVES